MHVFWGKLISQVLWNVLRHLRGCILTCPSNMICSKLSPRENRIRPMGSLSSPFFKGVYGAGLHIRWLKCLRGVKYLNYGRDLCCLNCSQCPNFSHSREDFSHVYAILSGAGLKQSTGKQYFCFSNLAPYHGAGRLNWLVIKWLEQMASMSLLTDSCSRAIMESYLNGDRS